MEKKLYIYFLIISMVSILITSTVLVFLFSDIIESDLNPSLTSMFIMISPAIIGIVVFIIILIYLLSSILTSKFIAPIRSAADNIESILRDVKVEDEFIYDELKPFISTIKVQKKEITSYIDKLVESEKIRSEFTANISHELKTPLTSINGYAEMIASGITSKEEAINFANIINKEGLRLLDLIDDIINLSKLESINGEEMLETFESIDLYELANDIVENQRNRALERNINLELIGEKLDFFTNKRMIENLISNLIDNAIKYNKDNGKVTVEVYKESNNCIIKVKDTGIGISHQDQDRVFERFYRADKSRSKKIGGTGIGLSIVKHIVEKHQGQVNLKSKLDLGTEVEIVLPESIRPTLYSYQSKNDN